MDSANTVPRASMRKLSFKSYILGSIRYLPLSVSIYILWFTLWGWGKSWKFLLKYPLWTGFEPVPLLIIIIFQWITIFSFKCVVGYLRRIWYSEESRCCNIVLALNISIVCFWLRSKQGTTSCFEICIRILYLVQNHNISCFTLTLSHHLCSIWWEKVWFEFYR